MIIEIIREFGLAFIATLGFGLLFNVPRRTLIPCGLAGGAGLTVRWSAGQLGASDVGATFLGALAVATMGWLFARRFHVPRANFTITGVIPMIPGVMAFTTMLQLATGDFENGITSGLQTGLIVGAIAMGLTAVRVLFYLVPSPEPPTPDRGNIADD